MPRALIVEEGFSRSVLAAARGLAAAGWEVGVGTPTRRGLARHSRAVGSWHRVPAVADGPDAFVEAVAGLTAGGAYDVVFPGGDAEVFALSEARGRIGAVVPYPQHEQVLRAFDKLALAAAARSAGLSSPETRLASAAAPDGERLPVVVKARWHWTPGSAGPARTEAAIASTPAELAALVAEVVRRGGEALLQQVVPGHNESVTVLRDGGGTVLGAAQHRVLRTFPVDAGSTVRAVVVPVEPGLLEGVDRLLDGLGWVGLAQLDFVVGDQGEPQLIDFNGRFYASMALELGAGANFAAAWAASATGAPVRLAPARVGTRFQWLEGDLRAGLASVDPAAVWSALAAAPRSVHAISRWDDPAPLVAQCVELLRRLPPKAAARLPWRRAPREAR